MKVENPIPQFSYLITKLAKEQPNLAYIHLVEKRAGGGSDDEVPEGESLEFARKAWRKTGRPFLVAGGYTPQNALEHLSKPGNENDVVVFGRWFIANVSLFPFTKAEDPEAEEFHLA